MAKISVIVPAHNVEKYIEQCIKSIMSQTYTELQIIIVDDGSEDATLQIVQALAEQDSRIMVLHQENCGVSSARNKGLSAATGEYIGFVDADDFINADMYARLVETAEETLSDIVLCNYAKTDEDGYIIRENIYAKNETVSAREALSWFNRSHGWTYTVVWNRLYKRELFEDLLFESGRIHEDEMIAHKLFSKCSKISSIDDVLYYYRDNSSSIMKKTKNIHNLDGFDAISCRYWDYKKWGYTELLPGTLECTKQFMALLNEINAESDSDKLRIHKMKKDFRLMVKDLGNKAGIINRIIAISPGLYYKFRDVFRGEK